METPDIIYLSPYKQGEGQDYIGLAWTHPSKSCGHVAYVRRDLIEGMIRDMKERIEQKPAEWSKEDEENLNMVLDMVKYCSIVPPEDVPSSTGHLHPSEKYKKELTEWLKSLRPQPKVEWSEDERIRKELIYWLKGFIGEKEGCGYTEDEIRERIAYLEKQKEQKTVVTHGETYRVDTLGTQQVIAGKMPQKPAEWSEEEKDKLNRIERLIVNANAHGNGLIGDKEAIELQHFIRSIVKPTTNLVEWSEEDRLHYANVLEALEYVKGCKSDYDKIEAVKSDIAWLKLLRNRVGKEFLQPNWKPSEEQMRALQRAVNKFAQSDVSDSVCLSIMYDNLKKLM